MEHSRDNTTEQDDSPEGEVVCPNCLASNGRFDHFCRKCGTPLTTIATMDPMGSIFARGDTFRKAVAHPRGRVVLVGMWLLFAPNVFLLPLLIIAIVDMLTTGGQFPRLMAAVLVLVVFVLYAAILVKTTMNYFRWRGVEQSGQDEDGQEQKT